MVETPSASATVASVIRAITSTSHSAATAVSIAASGIRP